MASARITCPDCKSVLRPAKPVPDGKKVKCPKCGKPFTTPGLVEGPEKPLRKTAPANKTKAAVKKGNGPKPPPQKADFDDDDDDGGGIYSFVGAGEEEQEKAEEDKPQIEYAPDLSIKDLRGPAQEAVVKPSNLMLLIGGLSALCNIFLICWSFWPMVFSESVVNWDKVLREHYKDDKNALQRIDGIKVYKDIKDKDLEIVQEAEEEETKWRFGYMGGFIGMLIYNAIAIIGAVKMQNLESRRWGIASSIMLLFPMGCGGLSCLIGGVFFFTLGTWILEEMGLYYSIGLAALPYLFALYVGATSLHILMSQQVIDGFEYVAE